MTGKTPSSSVEGSFGGPTPFVTPSDYDGSKYIRQTARGLTVVGENAIRSARIPPGAVMVTCIGSDMGKVALNVHEAFTNQQINSLIVEKGANAEYVYYNLLLRKAELRTKASGSAQPILNKTAFGAVELELPSIQEQVAVVDILRNIDLRVDLLRHTNASLESIARALFKSWFIDFDPVRAKAEGREPEGMDSETAALFPDSFEDSEFGEIPKGWRVGVFGELADLAKGSINPMKTPADTFEHYSLPAFDESQLPVFELGEKIKSNKTRVPAGAVLQSKLNPHTPRVWFPSRVGERAVCSTEFLPWVTKGTAGPEVIYCTLTSPSFLASVQTLVTGTSNSHQRVKADQVAALALVLAPSNVYNAFTRTAEVLLAKVGENRWTAKNLSDLRDTLLPRLISGKLRLPEAKAQLNEALA